jgi:hypothetical protein
VLYYKNNSMGNLYDVELRKTLYACLDKTENEALAVRQHLHHIRLVRSCIYSVIYLYTDRYIHNCCMLNKVNILELLCVSELQVLMCNVVALLLSHC